MNTTKLEPPAGVAAFVAALLVVLAPDPPPMPGLDVLAAVALPAEPP
jgi:hypothetical protein